MVQIIPSVDSTDFEFPPQVVAALIAQLPPAAPSSTFETDPDGTPVLVIGA
jgi:hypothetical protein